MRIAVMLTVCLSITLAVVSAQDSRDDSSAKSTTTSQKVQSKPKQAARDAKQILAPFNGLVGEWRGVAQPKRNSSRGAWFEKSAWEWDFSKTTPTVIGKIDKGKLAKSLAIGVATPATKGKELSISLIDPQGKTRTYFGAFDPNKKRLTAETTQPQDGRIHRLTITMLNSKRTVVLFENRLEKQSFWSRAAMVGYTRAGTSLAVSGTNEKECVVTGGKGTIKVRYNNTTYYVCCSGCKTAFDDDPAGTIAAYKERLAERKKKLSQ